MTIGNDAVQFETKRSTALVRFTRPEIRNPLSVEVLERLGEIVDEIKNDKRLNSLVFTGVGEVFASGADLREISQVTAAEAPYFARRGQALMRSISELPLLVVAAINGYCFGGALDLALACNRRIASPAALFAHPGAGLGIITGWGGTQRLPRLIGQAQAFEMFFTAKPFDADWALAAGLVDVIAPDPLSAVLQFVDGR